MQRFLLFSIVLLLAACNRNPLEVVVSRCPAVAIVGDTGTITKFADEARIQENLIFTASMGEVVSTCEQDDSVISNVNFKIYARSGDAFTGEPVRLSYFVGVLKDNSQLVSKETYDVVLNFDSRGQAVAVQSIETVVPSIEQARKYNYEVLLGFQLNYDEIYFNMVR